MMNDLIGGNLSSAYGHTRFIDNFFLCWIILEEFHYLSEATSLSVAQGVACPS